MSTNPITFSRTAGSSRTFEPSTVYKGGVWINLYPEFSGGRVARHLTAAQTRELRDLLDEILAETIGGFAIGDRVRLTDGGGDRTSRAGRGDTGVVAEVGVSKRTGKPDRNLITVRMDYDGHLTCRHPSRFEKIEETPELTLEPGDRVKVVGNSEGNAAGPHVLEIGSIAVVERVSPAGFPGLVRVTGKSKNSGIHLTQTLLPGDLEKAPALRYDFKPGDRVKGYNAEGTVVSYESDGVNGVMVLWDKGSIRGASFPLGATSSRLTKVEKPEPEPLKVGDRVKLVDTKGSLDGAKIGDRGEVVTVDSFLGLVSVRFDDGHTSCRFSRRFEKVEEPFAIGDRVFWHSPRLAESEEKSRKEYAGTVEGYTTSISGREQVRVRFDKHGVQHYGADVLHPLTDPEPTDEDLAGCEVWVTGDSGRLTHLIPAGAKVRLMPNGHTVEHVRVEPVDGSFNTLLGYRYVAHADLSIEPPAPVAKFKVGDRVETVKGVGTVVRVKRPSGLRLAYSVRVDGFTYPSGCADADLTGCGTFFESQIKPAPPTAKFKVGDRVKTHRGTGTVERVKTNGALVHYAVRIDGYTFPAGCADEDLTGCGTFGEYAVKPAEECFVGLAGCRCAV